MESACFQLVNSCLQRWCSYICPHFLKFIVIAFIVTEVRICCADRDLLLTDTVLVSCSDLTRHQPTYSHQPTVLLIELLRLMKLALRDRATLTRSFDQEIERQQT